MGIYRRPGYDGEGDEEQGNDNEENKEEEDYEPLLDGVIGSGVCILSKGPIVDSGMLKYNLNGYAHKIFHGDWFGGKVVGLCKVNYRGLNINLYVTHLHAEYNRHCDVYLSHRICQAFELSQYVKHTSENCDLALLGGDFNTEPLDPPYNIILYNTGLVDSFVDQEAMGRDSLCVGATCGHPDNTYTSSYEKSTCPTGKRIDYIMYKVGRGTPTWAASSSADCTLGLVDALSRGQDQLRQSLEGLHLDRVFYMVAACFMACILAATVPLHLPQVYHWILVLCRTLAAMLLGFCMIMAFFWIAMEKSSLIEARKAMRVIWKAHTNTELGTAPTSYGVSPVQVPLHSPLRSPLLELKGEQRV
ncbi:hypothetical protein HPB48_024771 [Haemaphysalis longicornis]|uniref:sphingomyelin phosphodiesterase n=1 Tax=Haemaphysalis longicornis TaxID=44386 RepID=A0A9J6H846_HAELO|nr:hypothetical protein HPB48_024771 [Haemaphysalis longicornis]